MIYHFKSHQHGITVLKCLNRNMIRIQHKNFFQNSGNIIHIHPSINQIFISAWNNSYHPYFAMALFWLSHRYPSKKPHFLQQNKFHSIIQSFLYTPKNHNIPFLHRYVGHSAYKLETRIIRDQANKEINYRLLHCFLPNLPVPSDDTCRKLNNG